MLIINFIGFWGITYFFYFLFLQLIKLFYKKDNFNNSIIPFILSVLALFVLSIVMGSYVQEIKYMFSSPSFIIISQIFTVLILTHILCDMFKLRFLKIRFNIFLKVFAVLFFILGIYISTLYIPFFENLFKIIFNVYQIPIIGFIFSIIGIVIYFIHKYFRKCSKVNYLHYRR